METPQEVLLVAEHEFELQRRMMEQTGGVLNRIRGYEVGPENVSGVHMLDAEGEDFALLASRAVPKMIERFTVVATTYESEGGPVDQERGIRASGEAVIIKLDTKMGTWVMICPIHRQPDRLERGDLVMPHRIGGRMVEAEEAKGVLPELLLANLELLLRDSTSDRDLWSALAYSLLARIDGTIGLHEAVPVFSARGLPDRNVKELCRLMDLIGQHESRHPVSPQDETTVHFLAGVTIGCTVVREGALNLDELERQLWLAMSEGVEATVNATFDPKGEIFFEDGAIHPMVGRDLFEIAGWAGLIRHDRTRSWTTTSGGSGLEGAKNCAKTWGRSNRSRSQCRRWCVPPCLRRTSLRCVRIRAPSCSSTCSLRWMA